MPKPFINPDGTCSLFPKLLYIEPTNHCTARCYMCPSRLGFREKGFMDLNLYKKLIDDIYAQVENPRFRPKSTIYLQGQGSPLMAKNLFKMIRYAKHRGFKVGFSTNAILLDKTNAEKIINSDLDVLETSLYALNREKYIAVHGVDQMESAFKNTIRFLHLSKGSKIKTSINILISERCLSEIEFLNYLYSRLPFNNRNNMIIRNFHGLFTQIGLTDEINFLNQCGRDMLHIPKIQEIFNLSPISEVGALRPTVTRCHTNVMLIYWDGDVNPCPADYEKRYIVGNVARENIFDIWDNDRYKAFRKVAVENNYSKMDFDSCNKCSMARYPYGSRYTISRANKKNYRFIMNNFPLDEEDKWMEKLEELRIDARKG